LKRLKIWQAGSQRDMAYGFEMKPVVFGNSH
jgi:hypothetical protein